MKRTRTHIFQRHGAAALALSLSLLSITGCTVPSKGQGPSSQEEALLENTSGHMSAGSYLEEDLPIPDDASSIEALKAQTDGSIAMIYGSLQEEQMQYSLGVSEDQGQSWRSTPLRQLLSMDQEEAESLLTFALGEEGQGFYGRLLTQGEDISMECWYRSPSGEVTLLPLSQEMENVFATDAAFDQEGHLYLSVLSKGILMVDPADGRVIHRFEEGNTVDFMEISGGCLAAVAGGSLHYYDTQTQKPAEGFDLLTRQIQKTTETLSRNNSSSLPILFLEDEQGIFFLNRQGLYHYSFGGTVVEQIIDGSRNSMSSPSTGFTSLTRGDDGSFYLGATLFPQSSSVPSGHVYRYTYQEDAPSAPDTVLTLYALRENGFLRQAASLFQSKYPDVQVTVQIGMTQEDGITRTDALKTLNTEIMAGKGPDLLLLDGLSTDTYVEKGLLTDLSSLFTEGELLENIQKAYTSSDGAIYSMPVSFGIPMIQGQKEDVDRITDLSTLADVIEAHIPDYGVGPDYGYFGLCVPGFAMTPQSLLFTLAPMCQSAWVSPEGSLNEAAIQDFFLQAGRIYQAEKAALDALQKKYPELLEETEPEAQDPPDSLSYGSAGVLQGSSLLALGGLYSPNNLAMLNSIEQVPDSGLSSKGWDTQVKGQFLPVNQVGISAKASAPEAALTFVRFLFSQEGQSISREYGFPTLRSLYEDTDLWSMGEPGKTVSTFSSSNTETGAEFSLDIKSASLETIRQLQDLGKSLSTPAAADAVIQDSVINAGLCYLKGELTLSQAVDSVQKEISLYLAE